MTMKKILLSFLALGGLMFASSCQMDEPDAGTLTGEVDFTITAGIPGSINTYASNDGGSTNVDKKITISASFLKSTMEKTTLILPTER